jgi:hypothetical protein
VIRRFKFEGDIAESLDFVPMAVRRKLDRIGLWIELTQWRALPRSDRLAICHLPSNLEEEREALALFIHDAVARVGGEPTELSPEVQEQAEPPSAPPENLVARAAELGFSLTPAVWTRLDADERYALLKLGSGQDASPELAAALKEIVVLS